MLKVFNVGQGDSFLLSPGESCLFHKQPLLIDCGPSSQKVATRFPDEEIDVLITHSHADHIGGLAGIFRAKSIGTLYLPYFLPELIKIHTYLKGHVAQKVGTPNWKKIKKINYMLIAQGDDLCGHATVLNPPRDPYKLDMGRKRSDQSIVQALETLMQLGIELPANEIVAYNSPLFDENGPNENQAGQRAGQAYNAAARALIHRFFITLAATLSETSAESRKYYLTRHLKLTSNQASIVFKYKLDNETFLFTGDADDDVFDRLMKEKVDIKAKFLKVPHHGSRGNLTRMVLRAIAPTHAIISHDNGKFGRAKDSHPHNEVIKILDDEEVVCYYTNPVIKDKAEIKPITTGKVLNGLIEFL